MEIEHVTPQYNTDEISRVDIFNIIVKEMTLRILLRHVFPDSNMSEEIARMAATKHAVRSTWYYYTHQEEFRSKLIYGLYKN